MNKSRLAVIILLAGIVMGVVLRITAVELKETLEHDEAISYLAATGHQADYARIGTDHPYGEWVEASEWKKHIQIDKKFCFSRIASDLTVYDSHPPLYFWLLHLWSLLFGIHLWTGPLLNIAIFVLSILLLYRLAERVLKNSVDAAAVASIWALSPTVIHITSLTRQYELLAIFTILLTFKIIQYIDSSREFRVSDYLVLVLATAGGILTHYQFSFIISGCGLLLSIMLIRKNRIRLAAGWISLIAGILLFALLHPEFYLSIESRMAGSGGIGYTEILSRLKTTAVVLASFFWKGAPLIYIYPSGIAYRYVYPILLILSLIGFGIIYVKNKLKRDILFLQDGASVIHIFYFLFWIAGLTILSYLFCFSPKHAMGAKYLAMAWPFFAFVPVIAIRSLGELKTTAIICACCLQAVFGTLDTLYNDSDRALKAESNVMLAESEMILLDNASRGILLSVLWHVPDEKLIFAADQQYLLENVDSWRTGFGPGGAYISVLLYGNTAKQQKEILGSLDYDYVKSFAPGPIAGAGSMFIVNR